MEAETKKYIAIEIKRIEEAIQSLSDSGRDMSEGSLVDLAAVLQQMVVYFKKNGIHSLVERHWDGPTKVPSCKQKRLER